MLSEMVSERLSERLSVVLPDALRGLLTHSEALIGSLGDSLQGSLR